MQCKEFFEGRRVTLLNINRGMIKAAPRLSATARHVRREASGVNTPGGVKLPRSLL